MGTPWSVIVNIIYLSRYLIIMGENIRYELYYSTVNYIMVFWM